MLAGGAPGDNLTGPNFDLVTCAQSCAARRKFLSLCRPHRTNRQPSDSITDQIDNLVTFAPVLTTKGTSHHTKAFDPFSFDFPTNDLTTDKQAK